MDPLSPLKRMERMNLMKNDYGDGSDYLVTQIKISVAGRFNCMSMNEGTFAMFSVDGVPITDLVEMPSVPGDCSCPTCITTYNATSIDHSSGWPGYNYNGYNSFEIFTEANDTNSLCVSYVDVTVIFVPGIQF